MVLAIYTLVTDSDKKTLKVILDLVFYIYYFFQFQKYEKTIYTLSTPDNKVYIITLVYAVQLGLKVWSIDIKTPKIDSLLFKTLNIIIACF